MNLDEQVKALSNEDLITLLKVLTCKDGEEEKIYREAKEREGKNESKKTDY